MIIHLNPSQAKAVLRSLDSRLNGIGRRRNEGTLKPQDESDELLCRQIRTDLVDAGITPRHTGVPPKYADWPYTWRCLDCDYVGWPNTTDIKGGFRWSCPRSQDHREMVHITITHWDQVADHSTPATE